MKRMIAAVVVAAALAACGGGSKSGSGHKATAADLAKGLVGPADLGAGYAPSTDAVDDDSAFCKEHSAGDASPAAAKAETQFRDASSGRSVFEGVNSYDDEKQAEKVMEVAREGVAKCGTFTQSGADGTTNTITLASLPVGKVGDETVAGRVTSTGSQPFSGAVVLVRDGKVVTAVMQVGPVTAGDAAAVEALARKANEKVDAAVVRGAAP